MPLSGPEPLNDSHRIDEFDSGVPPLNDWLKGRGRANQTSGASRTYVITESAQVIGYYAFASGAIGQAVVTGRFRRNMPDPIPVAILARLAIDAAFQGRGLRRAMFRDAAIRVAGAQDSIGIRGIVVHAISEEAKRLYLALGFDPCVADSMTLAVTLGDLRAALGLEIAP